MLAAILWDNDGVLVDTERLFYEANRDFFRQHDIDLTPEDFFTYFLCKDTGIWFRLQEAGFDEAYITNARARRNALYTERLLAAKNLHNSGIASLISRFHGAVRMAVVTSASQEHYAAIHRASPFQGKFEFVLTAENYARPKPNPEPYLAALTRLSLTADECVVVEDSPRGLQAASAAGIRCIILRTALTRDHHFSGALAVVDSVADLERQLGDLISP